MTIDLQPLMHNQHLERLNILQTAEMQQAINNWDEGKLHINKLIEYKALIETNFAGHNYCELLRELASQISNHTDQLHFKVQKRPTEFTQYTKDELLVAYQNNGYQPLPEYEDILNDLYNCTEVICTFGELINAINQQLINSHGTEVTLKIGQTKDVQKRWNRQQQTTTEPNFPKSINIGKLKLVPKDSMFEKNDSNE